MSGTTFNTLFDPSVVGQPAPNALAPPTTYADAWQFNAEHAQAELERQRAISEQRGLWAQGGPTAAGVRNAAQQYGNAILMGSTAPSGRVTLFHGTSPEGLAEIKATGRINGPAFFSPRKDAAFDYAGGGPVVEVKVPKSALKVDFDLPGGQLLDVENANGYSGKEDWTIDDYLDAGHSVGIEGHLPVEGAKFHEPD